MKHRSRDGGRKRQRSRRQDSAQSPQPRSHSYRKPLGSETSPIEHDREKPGDDHPYARWQAKQDNDRDRSRQYSQARRAPGFGKSKFADRGRRRKLQSWSLWIRERAFRQQFGMDDPNLRGITLRAEWNAFLYARTTLIAGLFHRISRYRSG
jgi:hypothetical protein